MLSNHKEIVLPEAVKELSTKRLLTMTRTFGSKVMKFIEKNRR